MTACVTVKEAGRSATCLHKSLANAFRLVFAFSSLASPTMTPGAALSSRQPMPRRLGCTRGSADQESCSARRPEESLSVRPE